MVVSLVSIFIEGQHSLWRTYLPPLGIWHLALFIKLCSLLFLSPCRIRHNDRFTVKTRSRIINLHCPYPRVLSPHSPLKLSRFPRHAWPFLFLRNAHCLRYFFKHSFGQILAIVLCHEVRASALYASVIHDEDLCFLKKIVFWLLFLVDFWNSRITEASSKGWQGFPRILGFPRRKPYS